VHHRPRRATGSRRPEFLSQAAARNLGVTEAKTRLAVVMDCDNFVRPGWIEALVRCQNETGAVMVVPIVLEGEHRIHTAGNDLYIDLIDGVRFGHKCLRYHGKPYREGSNLGRCKTDCRGNLTEIAFEGLSPSAIRKFSFSGNSSGY
jgi:GT2 family glycosyltransferase